jgi:hypothetical protein
LRVIINSSGQLGPIQSSARFKDNIKPMDKTSEAILKLEPVTFHYKHKLDPNRIPHFGLIAEQVEKVNPDLVVCDEEGKVTTFRYEAVSAMLLNEFLKEHAQVRQLNATVAQQQNQIAAQQATAAQQQRQIEALTVTVRKVSERVELRATRSANSSERRLRLRLHGLWRVSRGLVAGRITASGLTVCTPPMSMT